MEKWLASYERRRRSRNPKEPNGWISCKYDLHGHWREVQQTCVPELQMNVGQSISALRKSWRAYKIAGRNGEPRKDLAYRINHIEDSLGLEKFQFEELAERGIYNEEPSAEEAQLRREEEQEESSGEWNLTFDYKKSEPVTDEWSDLDKELLQEEILEEQESGDDWFS